MNSELLKQMANDPAVFRQHLIVPSHHGPRKLAEIVADFQQRDFLALDPALVAVAKGEKPSPGRAWRERTKGASKDSDIAVEVLWLLLFSPRMLTIQCAAADSDQADELRRAIRAIVRLNAWIEQAIDVQRSAIVNKRTGSQLDVLSADAASSHGARPDVLILNELTHIGDQDFAETLLDNAAKMPHGLVVVATNAGFLGSWQADLRDVAQTSGRWYFSCYTKPAPWLDAAEIEERRKTSPPNRFARLWEGEWVADVGDALDADDLAAAIKADMQPMERAEEGWVFGAGLDLGLAQDHSALVVVGRKDGRYRLARVWTWAPTAIRRVDISDVESKIREAHRVYRWTKALADPWQSDLLTTRLNKSQIPFEKFALSMPNWDKLTRSFVGIAQEGSLDVYPHPGLVADLRACSIVEKTTGQMKLIWPRGDSGHGDRGMAFVLALFAANSARLPQSLPSSPSFYRSPAMGGVAENVGDINPLLNPSPDRWAHLRRQRDSHFSN